MSKTQCAVYDFRWNADDLTPDIIKGYLKGVAKRYVFQLEKGDKQMTIPHH